MLNEGMKLYIAAVEMNDGHGSVNKLHVGAFDQTQALAVAKDAAAAVGGKLLDVEYTGKTVWSYAS